MFFRKIIVVISFLLVSSSYGKLEVVDKDDLQGLIPAYWFDRTGFHIVGDEALSGVSIPATVTMAPVFPIYDSGLFKKTYLGGMVPSKYLYKLSHSQQEKLIYEGQRMLTPEGYRHNFYFHNQDLYFIRSDYSVVRSSGISIGLDLSFGGRSKTAILGDMKVYGISLSFSDSIRIGEEKGLNIGKSFQDLISTWNSLSKKDDSGFIYDQAINLAPTLLKSITSSRKTLVDENGKTLRPLSTTYNGFNETSVNINPYLVLSGSHSKEWHKQSKDLKKNLSKEVQFKKDLENHVAKEVIVDDEKQNQFLQKLCDRLATAYNVPEEIWPRCRVAATAVPNAWAYPGGNIFFSAGLLGILSDVDAVANVLGHEIGHVVARHGSRSKKYHEAYYYGASMLSLGSTLALTGVSLTGGLGIFGDLTWLTWFPEMMVSSTAGGYMAGKALEIAMYAPAAAIMMYSRENELQADRLGQESAFQVGMDFKKMTNGWIQFSEFFKSYVPVKESFMQKVMRSHPNDQKRIKSLDKRKNELHEILERDNEANAITGELQVEYFNLIHKVYKPLVHAWGRETKSNILKLKKDGATQKHNHVLHMFASGQNDCIAHALGALEE